MQCDPEGDHETRQGSQGKARQANQDKGLPRRHVNPEIERHEHEQPRQDPDGADREGVRGET
jgi:hypothetical protein